MPQRSSVTARHARAAGPAPPLVVAILLLLAASIVLTPAVRAAVWPSEWKPFGLQGLTIRAIAAAPGVLCAGTEEQGVLCRDPGASGPATAWQPIGPAGVTVTWLWIDPALPAHRFVAAGATWPSPSLYRTLDGGASWTVIDHFPSQGGYPGRAWAVDGAPGGGPLWAAGGGAWVSGDLGDTWSAGGPYAGLDCIEVAPSDPLEVWSGGETAIFMGFTVRTLDGGVTWESVWDSGGIGDNQTADVAAHPSADGLALTGHEGFVLRTANHGGAWEQVLTAPARFFLAWDGASPDMAFAAGSPNGGTAHAFASRDRGRTWADITGATLAPRTVFRVAADGRRNGVLYAATDDGVFRHYGGGLPVCLDTRAGMAELRLSPGACAAAPGASTPGVAAPGVAAPGASTGSEPPFEPWSAGAAIPGDVIAFDLGQVVGTATRIDLGEVECLVAGGDVSLAAIDMPDPAPGHALGILARSAASLDYGVSSDGRARHAASGDCP